MQFLVIQLGAICFMAEDSPAWLVDRHFDERKVLLAGCVGTLLPAADGADEGAGPWGVFVTPLALVLDGLRPLAAGCRVLSYPARGCATPAVTAFNLAGVVGGGATPIVAQALAADYDWRRWGSTSARVGAGHACGADHGAEGRCRRAPPCRPAPAGRERADLDYLSCRLDSATQLAGPMSRTSLSRRPRPRRSRRAWSSSSRSSGAFAGPMRRTEFARTSHWACAAARRWPSSADRRGVVLDEQARPGAARQGLEPSAPEPANRSPTVRSSKRRGGLRDEQRLARAVGSRTRRFARRRLQHGAIRRR